MRLSNPSVAKKGLGCGTPASLGLLSLIGRHRVNRVEEVIINTLISRRSDQPGDLAQELAEAREKFEAKRADVVDRGVTRQRDIEAMQRELQEEHVALGKVVDDAQK